MNKEEYNYRLCEERHEDIDKVFEAVRRRFDKGDSRMNGMDKKLWAVLASNIAILGGIIGVLIMLLGQG